MPESTDWYPTENADWYPQRLRWPGPGRLQLRLKPQLRRARAVWSFVFVSSITLLTLLYGLLKDWFDGLVRLTGHNEILRGFASVGGTDYSTFVRQDGSLVSEPLKK